MKRAFVLFAVLALSLTLLHGVLPELSLESKSKERLQSPPKYLKHMTFGFNDITADMLWLRFIQDIDHCNELDWASAIVEARCIKGWGYEMILSIHQLTPKFRIPMAVGPMALSVLQDDTIGSGELFVKAAEAFPKDWPILYRAAYHFIYEENDPARAAEYLNRAAANGGPLWLPSLAARMYDKGGRQELAIRTLEDYKKTIDDPQAKKKVEARIQALKSTLTP